MLRQVSESCKSPEAVAAFSALASVALMEEATVVFDSFSGLPVTVLTKDGGVEKPDFGEGDDITPFVNELTEARKAFTTGVPSSLLDGALARDALILCHKQVESILWRKRVEI